MSDLVQNFCFQTLQSPQMNLQQKPSTTSEPLNSSIYERHPFACVLLVFSSMTAFKISLIYVQGCKKRDPTHTCQHGPKIRFGNSDFVDLNRYFCRAFVKLSSLNLNIYEFVKLLLRFCRAFVQLLSNFNEQLFFTCFLVQSSWL